VTPNDIEILLHCHCCPEPHPRARASAVSESLEMLLLEGLVQPYDSEHGRIAAGTFITTDRGRAHVEQLCNLPFPERAWIDASGKVIG
jgi:hypothetical protein